MWVAVNQKVKELWERPLVVESIVEKFQFLWYSEKGKTMQYISFVNKKHFNIIVIVQFQ